LLMQYIDHRRDDYAALVRRAAAEC